MSIDMHSPAKHASMTPDGRTHALKKLGSPDHYNGNIELRYALGDDVEPVFNQRYSMIQLAAVRARMISLAEQNYQPALPIAQASVDDQQRVIVSGALIEDPTVPFSMWEKALSFEPGRTSHLMDPESTWTASACRLAILAASHERSKVRIETTDAIIEAATRLPFTQPSSQPPQPARAVGRAWRHSHATTKHS